MCGASWASGMLRESAVSPCCRLSTARRMFATRFAISAEREGTRGRGFVRSPDVAAEAVQTLNCSFLLERCVFVRYCAPGQFQSHTPPLHLTSANQDKDAVVLLPDWARRSLAVRQGRSSILLQRDVTSV